MITKKFKSDLTNDIIETYHRYKSNDADYKMLEFDDLSENIKLVMQMIEYLKNNNIKWMKIPINDYDLSQNILFKKRDDVILIHIEDYEKFYLLNVKNIIKPKNIHIDELNTTDGWTTVFNKKKEKLRKFNKIKEEIETLIGDWNNIN